MQELGAEDHGGPREPVVWVTGGGSGMGRAAALSAAIRGWRVALSGRRPERVEAVAREVEVAGGEVLALPGDVRSGDDVMATLAAVEERWGRLDALVLAAGRNAPRRTWQDQDLRELGDIIDTNLVSVARVVQLALPQLRSRGGTVVVVSSYAGWRFSPGAGVAYSVSKTALSSLCQLLNAQEAGSGVRACHLCPGDVDTEFLAHRPEVPRAAARSVMLTADDVARAVQFVLESPAHVRIDELVLSPVSQH
ncbi:MAG TPA: SDR family oxidoreductase [Nocardioidaceae bacterium]|nr:SDR family oxidoreductase [Nocardioidaceae bacterium]